MNPITIDGKTYNPQDLSEQARAHLAHLAYIETELQRMMMGINVLRISRQRINELLRQSIQGGEVAAEPAAASAAEPAKAAAKTGKSRK